MKWWQRSSKDSEDTFTLELITRYGTKGFYCWNRIRDLMALHYNIYDPGCNRFLKSWFYMQFSLGIRRNETVNKILEFLHAKGEIYSGFETRHVCLWWPELPKLADKYTYRCHVDANKNEKVPPIDAGILSVFVKHYVLKNRKKLPNYEKEFADNKELKGKIVGT